MTTLAAIVYLALSAVVVGFQLGLAAGAPWGHLAMGGRFPGRHPPRMRAVAVLNAALLVGWALVIGARAGLFLPGWSGGVGTLAWVAVGFAALGLVMNLATPSKPERRLWAPVAAVLLACSVVVALG